MRNYLVLGKWNVVCDRCGFKFKNDQLKKEWTGLMVCHTCWEPRHPQTLIKVPEECIGVPWSRPEPDEVYVATDAIQTEENPLIFDINNNSDIPLLIERNTGFLVTEEGEPIDDGINDIPLQTES
jgi:hypothetical protein